MRYMVLSVVVVVPLLFAAFLMRRDRLRRAGLDRRGLDDLRRIYRRDNPRGPGLEPIRRDQQPRVRPEGRAKR